MKKIIIFLILAIAIISLTACGKNEDVEKVFPSPTMSLEPLESPSPSPTYLEASPMELPCLDFKIAKIYESESFGANGKAFLFMGEIIDSEREFAIFFAEDFDRQSIENRPNQMLYASEISGTISGENFNVNCSFGANIKGKVLENEGVISLEYLEAACQNPSLNFDFSNIDSPKFAVNDQVTLLDFSIYLPYNFKEISEEISLESMKSMVFMAKEAVLPINLSTNKNQLVETFGEPVSQNEDEISVSYYFENAEIYGFKGENDEIYVQYFKTDSVELSPNVRGINVGCHIDDLLKRLPVKIKSYDELLKEIDDNLGTKSVILYGDDDILSAQCIFRTKDESYVQLSQQGDFWLKFYLADDGEIGAISVHKN